MLSIVGIGVVHDCNHPPVMPIVGGLELFFLSLPSLDFNLGGIAAAGDLPGFSNLIRIVLDAILRRGFVWPNRFHMFLPLKVSQSYDIYLCLS